MELRGKTVLITSASRGLGYALANLLAERGANLVLAARERGALDAVADALRNKTAVAAAAADVSQDAEWIVRAGLDRFGQIDVLVNNASELGPSPLPNLASLAWPAVERLLRVNVTAPLHLMQLVLPGMLARNRGIILNITSDAAVNAYPTWGGYGASKAALEHLGRVLVAELGEAAIRVLTVDPGDMNTAMHRAAEPGVDLSALPPPEAVAPALVRLMETDAPSGRYEAQKLHAGAR